MQTLTNLSRPTVYTPTPNVYIHKCVQCVNIIIKKIIIVIKSLKCIVHVTSNENKHKTGVYGHVNVQHDRMYYLKVNTSTTSLKASNGL